MLKGRLILEPCKEEGRFRLVQPLTYESAKYGVTVFVPWGFDTDGASIPFLLNELWKKGGKKMAAAVVHDYIYRTGLVSRDIADGIFLELMEELGVPRIKRYSMYYGVRTFGWMHYRGDNGQYNSGD